MQLNRAREEVNNKKVITNVSDFLNVLKDEVECIDPKHKKECFED